MLHQQLALLGSLGHHGTVAQSHAPQTVTCLVGQRCLQPLQDRRQPETTSTTHTTRTYKHRAFSQWETQGKRKGRENNNKRDRARLQKKERERQRETERQRDRETERERDIQRQRELLSRSPSWPLGGDCSQRESWSRYCCPPGEGQGSRGCGAPYTWAGPATHRTQHFNMGRASYTQDTQHFNMDRASYRQDTQHFNNCSCHLCGRRDTLLVVRVT